MNLLGVYTFQDHGVVRASLARSCRNLETCRCVGGRTSSKHTLTSSSGNFVIDRTIRFQAWASCLPEHLQFNDRNFVLNVKKLGSVIPTTASCGFCFALMHSIAESSQFYLQSIAAIAGDISHSITATRQSQAVDNMTVVIDTIGDIGRQSPEGTHCRLLIIELAANPSYFFGMNSFRDT